MTVKKANPFALLEMFLQQLGSNEPTYANVSRAFNLANDSIPVSEEEEIIKAIEEKVKVLKEGMN